MKRKLRIFKCKVFYNSKLIASDIVKGTSRTSVEENSRDSFIDWLEFEVIEIDADGKVISISVK